MGVGGQCHSPATLPTGQTRYLLYRKLRGPQGQPGLVWIILLPLRFNPQTVQPILSCYTNWAILVHHDVFVLKKKINTLCCPKLLYTLLLLSCKFSRPNMCFTCNIHPDACDSFTGPGDQFSKHSSRTMWSKGHPSVWHSCTNRQQN
jgi:hypothetical protein